MVVAISSAILLTSSVASFAEKKNSGVNETIPKSPENTILQESPKLICTYGNVVEIAENQIRIKSSDEDLGVPEGILRVNENTAIIDAVSGLAVELKDIKEGEPIYAYINPAMTRSIPPIANVEAIIAKIPTDSAVPAYIEVKELVKGADGSLKVLAEDNRLLATMTKEMTITPYLTKNIVTLDDIRVGSKLFVWYQIATMSIPPQATPEKAVLLPYEYDSFIKVNGDDIYVDGQKIKLGEDEIPYKDGDVTMVPLRAVSEACGYIVEWKGVKEGIIMSKEGNKEYKLVQNEDIAAVDGAKLMLNVPVAVKNSRTFVSIETFSICQNAKIIF